MRLQRLHAFMGLFILLTIPLAGCMDAFGDDPETYDGITHEVTLEVKPSVSDTIPLYTLNDGEREMRVVAMGFTAPSQETLSVPNPEIRLREGDTLILTVINNNPLDHTFHLHGGLIPWEMDGVPFFTQEPIKQGQQYTYTFEDLKAGTYFYHCHVDVAHHIDLGMYGAFIVEEREPEEAWDREYVLMLDEWDNCHVHGNRDPVENSEQSGEFSNRADCFERFLQDNLAQNMVANQATGPVRDPACDQPLPDELRDELDCDADRQTPPQQEDRSWYPVTHPVYAPIYNSYLINGKAFPDTRPMVVAEGETIKVRLINVGEEMHSMHIHGHNMLVTHRDGYRLESPFRVDTLGIMPGERYDVIVEADNPGYWVFHDHVGLHVMNDDHAPGGMLTCIAYDDFYGRDADSFGRSLDCATEARAIFEEQGIGQPA